MEHQGLEEKEAQERLTKFGPNKFPEAFPPSDLKILLLQLKSPLVYILLFAATVTILLRDFTDTIVILFAVSINTILGFYQERKAERTLLALKKILTPHAKTIRDGKLKIIEANLLVPGDLVVLSQGEKIPADGVVVESVNLSINEAILTGESMPVGKKVAKIKEAASASSASSMRNLDNETMKPLNNESVVFMGTTVSSGRGKVLVTKTGKDTEIGKIAIKLKTLEEEKTPLQERIAVLARTLAILTGGICGLIFLTGILLGKSALEMFTTSVAIAVAAIPEGMVVSLTVILAIGMQKILRRKALVRRLLAAETLGSVTIIATDKTGTLTQGELKVVETDFTDKNLACLAAILVNNLADPLETALWEWTKNKDSGLGVQGSRLEDPQKIVEENPRVFEMPFDSERKYQVVICKMQAAEVSHINFCGPQLTPRQLAGRSKATSKNFVASPPPLAFFISGAPEVVLSKCKLSDKEKENWLEKIEKWGREGLRIIGLGFKRLEGDVRRSNQSSVVANATVLHSTVAKDGKVNKGVGEIKAGEINAEINEVNDLTWLGLVGFEDPVREGVAEALKACQEAGIKVKMITGDYAETAAAVWSKLTADGVEVARQNFFRAQSARQQVSRSASPQKLTGSSRLTSPLCFLNGSEIEKMPFEKLKRKIEEVEIFARVTPTQKLKIVEALKEKGEVVALVGDGVNDAPALKRADIGIVVGGASDVAKETADMVLLDSNFSTIVAAIEEGRGIFENIKKVILYLLSDSFSEILLVLGSLVFSLPLPLSAAQILYINLITDGFPDLALTVEPKEKELLKRKPIKKEASLLDLEGKLLIGLISFVTGIMCLMLFHFFLKRSGLVLARTIAFVALGIDSLFYVFSVRSLKKSILKVNLFSNPYLLIAVALGLLLQIIPLYNPVLRKFLQISPLNFYHWLLILTTSLFVIILIEAVKFCFIKKKWLDR